MTDGGEELRLDVERLAPRLEAELPAPSEAFRATLGRALVRESTRRRLRPRPRHLWGLVAVLAASGTGLLGLAAALV